MHKLESASASVPATSVHHRHACTATMIITPTRARLTGTTDLIISLAEFSSAQGRGSTDFMDLAVTATTVAVISAADTTGGKNFAGISGVEESGTSADPEAVTSRAVEAESSKAGEVVTSEVEEVVTSTAAEAVTPAVAEAAVSMEAGAGK
jgi:hypothetical protein